MSSTAWTQAGPLVAASRDEMGNADSIATRTHNVGNVGGGEGAGARPGTQ